MLKDLIQLPKQCRAGKVTFLIKKGFATRPRGVSLLMFSKEKQLVFTGWQNLSKKSSL